MASIDHVKDALIGIPLDRSWNGIPAIWEEGGDSIDTGWSRIVASHEGKPKIPLWVPKWKIKERFRHALIPISINDHIVLASHYHQSLAIWVYRIVHITNNNAILVMISEFDEGEWILPLPSDIPYLEKAVLAAKSKAFCYYCQSPHYIAR
jgi:hypothetical protein